MLPLASIGGSTIPAIAHLVQTDEDTIGDAIHRFNEIRLACLNPHWAGCRPHLPDSDDKDFVIQTATTHPTVLGMPSTRCSVRKLVDHLHRTISRPIQIGREAHRCLPARNGTTFQRTKTWKETPGPAFNTKLERNEYADNECPHRTFAFDELGPLSTRPTTGSCWHKQDSPGPPATYRRTHDITYFHGCYSAGDNRLWGTNRCRKGTIHTWAAQRSIRPARPNGPPIYVTLDNLSVQPSEHIPAANEASAGSADHC
ncbi:hypothetical protein ABZ799_26510 [Nocardiopsis dassonvillei]|uniref:hypothetical protein n=1 Tax=Nocardiopsis dassonvillei TaxID=2014 RepID=UPI0033C7E2F1